MVMLGALKGKLNDEMAAPEMEVEGEEAGMEGEEMPEAKPMDLTAVSDEELTSEMQRRGLM
jgi:hypothetical protein